MLEKDGGVLEVLVAAHSSKTVIAYSLCSSFNPSANNLLQNVIFRLVDFIMDVSTKIVFLEEDGFSIFLFSGARSPWLRPRCGRSARCGSIISGEENDARQVLV